MFILNLTLLEDWGPYGPPTSSTCGGPAGDPSGPQIFLGMIGGPFGSPKICGQKYRGPTAPLFLAPDVGLWGPFGPLTMVYGFPTDIADL